MDQVFFLSATAWNEVRARERFDYIIVGSGFCALAFVERLLGNDPYARILIIERGPFFLPDHFQNLPLPYRQVMGGLAETFPWTLSARMREAPFIKWQSGMVPFFGGRSLMWSAWCPRPLPEEMEGWPPEVIRAANEYFDKAEELLHVIPATQISRTIESPPPGQCPIYGTLQKALAGTLQAELHRVPSATRAMAAPLAVAVHDFRGMDFVKFSTPGPLLTLVQKQLLLAERDQGAPLRIVTDCTVMRILQQNGRATALDTTRGLVPVGDGKVILAMGTLPATTLIANSFPGVKNVGKRFTAHFISTLVARVPREDFVFQDQLGDLELAALYFAGVDQGSKKQYHIQVTALADRDPAQHAATANRYMPDVVVAASPAQLLTSKEHIVFACALVGEMEPRNEENWFKRNEAGHDPTTNMVLQVLANEADGAVWDAMETGAFQALERIFSPRGAARVEYWHGQAGAGTWERKRPPVEQIRIPALIHDGSTMWIGNDEDEEAVVGLDYRPRGVENVHVTGAALWPAGGSWNPTLTMVALAQNLADRLAHDRRSKKEEAGVL